jgi:hypothetical protein
MGERLMGLLDDLRRAGLVDLHVPIQPLPPEPLVSDALLGAYGWDVAGLQAARYERAHSGMGAWRPPLPEAHRVRGDRGGAAATRRDRVRRGLDPLGGEVACQVVTAFTLPAAQYMASRYLDVPGASALGEPDLLPETAPAAREHLMRFLDADGNLRADLARDGSEQSWRGHLAGAARRWWVGAAVLDGLQRWGTEPLHAYYRQATDIAFLRGWRRPEGVHPALERAGTVRSWSEWGTRTMLWTGILANVRHGPSSDSMAVLRLRFVLGEERELTAMIETGVRGPVDVRRRAAHIELVHDRPVGALKPKVHRLLEREGPAQVQASDGLRAWPLEATPPLLIVVPGALSLNGDAPRDRAESVLSMALRHAWYLVRSERLDRPYGALLLAVCHLQDLRDQGWTAPIWYRLRAPARPPVGVDEDPLSLSMIDWDWQADAPARRSLVDLARSSLPTRAPVQLAGHRDLAGLSIGFRLRLNNGDGWRVVYRSGKTQAI